MNGFISSKEVGPNTTDVGRLALKPTNTFWKSSLSCSCSNGENNESLCACFLVGNLGVSKGLGPKYSAKVLQKSELIFW